MHLVPQSWSHVHILVGVFPSFGLLFLLGFYIAGYLTKNDGIKRTCLALFVLLALLAVPTYFTGVAALVVLWQSGRAGRASNVAFYLVSGLAIVALGLMIVADGWEVSHRE